MIHPLIVEMMGSTPKATDGPRNLEVIRMLPSQEVRGVLRESWIGYAELVPPLRLIKSLHSAAEKHLFPTTSFPRPANTKSRCLPYCLKWRSPLPTYQSGR